MRHLLTIAIPTFNRQEQLGLVLSALREQENPAVKLVVFDNASEPPVASIVGSIFEGTQWDVCVHRNLVNVGMSANILKCFEFCQTEWLWILGDDDTVLPCAVTQIVDEISHSRSELLILHRFEFFPGRPEGDEACDLEGFLRTPLAFPASVFLSSSLYRASKIRKHLQRAFEYTHTFAPHTAAFLLAGAESPRDEIVRCHPRPIISWKAASPSERYSIFFGYRLAGLIKAVPRKHRQLAGKSLVSIMTPHRRLYLHAARDISEGENPSQVMEFYETYSRKLLEMEPSITHWIAVTFWRLLLFFHLLFPRLGYIMLTSLYRMTLRAELQDTLQSKRLSSHDMQRVAYDAPANLKTRCEESRD